MGGVPAGRRSRGRGPPGCPVRGVPPDAAAVAVFSRVERAMAGKPRSDHGSVGSEGARPCFDTRARVPWMTPGFRSRTLRHIYATRPSKRRCGTWISIAAPGGHVPPPRLLGASRPGPALPNPRRASRHRERCRTPAYVGPTREGVPTLRVEGAAQPNSHGALGVNRALGSLHYFR